MLYDGIDEMGGSDCEAGDTIVRDRRAFKNSAYRSFDAVSYVGRCRRLEVGDHPAVGRRSGALVENDGVCVRAAHVHADANGLGSDAHAVALGRSGDQSKAESLAASRLGALIITMVRVAIIVTAR